MRKHEAPRKLNQRTQVASGVNTYRMHERGPRGTATHTTIRTPAVARKVAAADVPSSRHTRLCGPAR